MSAVRSNTPSGWVNGYLADFLEESTERNKDGATLPVFSVTNDRGFLPQIEQFARVIHSKETGNYKIFRAKQFGFNPSRINVGSISLNGEIEAGLLSPMYVVFSTKEGLQPLYLKHYTETFEFRRCVINNTAGSVRESLKFSAFRNFPFRCPASMKEQAKIAEILSTVDRAIERTEALIAKQERIKTGLMQDLLTRGIDEQGNLRSEETHEFKDSPLGRIPVEWVIRKLGKLGNIIRGASPRPKGDPKYYGGDIPRLMVEDVTRDGKWVTPKVDFLTIQGAKLSRLMPAGSLTVVCSGTVGIPWFLAVDACIHDGFLGFTRIDESCLPEFLYYILIHELDNLDSSATHGGVFTNLTTDIVKEFLVSLPNVTEQEKIVNILSSTDEDIERTRLRLKKLRSLKTALMQDLLTGKVRVTSLLESTD